jgi:hypothetical protein
VVSKRKKTFFDWLCEHWACPLMYWGMPGCLWQNYHRWTTVYKQGHPFTVLEQPGSIPSPIGGVIESIVRRRRQCIICGHYFWRKGAGSLLAGVNIFEEHCSRECADEYFSRLPN